MNISIIAAPATAQQTLSLPAFEATRPSLNSQDHQLLKVIGEHDRLPIPALLNFLASEQAPTNRSEERKLWLDAWHHLRRLLRLGLVFRADRTSVSLLKSVSEIRHRPVKRRTRKPTVSPNTDEHRASTETLRTDAPSSNPLEEPQNQLPTAQPIMHSASESPDETESAPTREQIALAAISLAKLPRRPRRKWTGWIGQTHAYRNMRIILPSGEVAFVAGVLRGKCVFTLDAGKLIGGFDGEPFRWGVVPVREVRVLKNLAAQQLAARRRGVKERPSALKAQTARRNGRMPCREGLSRGRPTVAINLR